MTEKELDILLLEAQRVKDRADIENLFGTYQYYRSVIRDEKIMELFSKKLPDVRIDWGHGLLEGYEELKKYYVGRPRSKGKMIVHSIMNPIIEVAEDGQSAKGFWISAGHESCPYYEKPDVVKDRDWMAAYVKGPDQNGFYKYVHWVWNKYGVDFVKEEDGWKIWHIREVELMRAPYDEDWIDFSISRQVTERLAGLSIPWDGLESSPLMPKSTRESDSYTGYHVDRSPVEEPRRPEPYKTFSETFAY